MDENWLERIIEEYGSLEEYIAEMNEQKADPLLYGYPSFEYLLSKKLLREEDIIRTNLEGGMRDGHYIITEKGQLEGIEANPYSGDPGIHLPEKILSLKKADNGWTLGSFAITRIKRSIKR